MKWYNSPVFGEAKIFNISKKELFAHIKRINEEIDWIEKRERHLIIYGWYRSYRRANPENSIKTSFKLAKMSYEFSLQGMMVFTPYIPKTPVPEFIPYVPESLRQDWSGINSTY
jgi:hypothetical protein